MAIYPREDARTALPQLEKKFTTMADEFNKKMDGMLDFFYPVGSYYETSDTAFDPNEKWGGTWELELAGQVHVSAGTGYSVSGAETNTSDGGASTVTLSTEQMPSHTHTQNSHSHHVSSTFVRYINKSAIIGSGSSYRFFSEDSGLYTDSATATNQNTGGGEAHNNMQPYIVVNRWHRVN